MPWADLLSGRGCKRDGLVLQAHLLVCGEPWGRLRSLPVEQPSAALALALAQLICLQRKPSFQLLHGKQPAWLPGHAWDSHCKDSGVDAGQPLLAQTSTCSSLLLGPSSSGDKACLCIYLGLSSDVTVNS